MADFLKARKFTYETHVLVEGRWRIEAAHEPDEMRKGGIFNKSDVDAVEKRLIAQAKKMLATGKYEAIKVLRERARSGGGEGMQTEIFNEVAEEREKVLTARDVKEQPPPCDSFDDLSSRTSCRVLNLVLRDFFEEESLSALETLHSPWLFKMVDLHYPLVGAAIHLVARKQALEGRLSARERAEILQDLLRTAISWSRDAASERNRPELVNDDFHALYEAAQARFETQGEIRYFCLHAVARAMRGSRSHFARIDFVRKNVTLAMERQPLGILDELLAGCLDFPSVIVELLGSQPSLFSAIDAMADLATGSYEPPVPNPAASDLSNLLRDTRLEQARNSLWLRIIGEVEGRAPLMRKEPTREWKATMELEENLTPSAPMTYRLALRDGFKERLRRLREQEG
ncbi:MAG: hypothetical protein RIB84_11450 [Sneathiellaceae bacterium]